MTRIQEALCLAALLILLAVLAVFDIIPAAVALYAPLAMAVWIIRREPGCTARQA